MKHNPTKSIAACALSIMMLLSMSACGHQHTWVDATCTAPKTCTECGETEGEALGHSWVDATCAAPKTCSVCKETEGETQPHSWVDATCAAPKTCSACGETEGETLPHTLTEANFQTPATCTVCGATEGDVLTPDFVTYGIQLAELGETHDIILACQSQYSDKTTVAHVTATDYQVFESNETFPAKEGYEYRQVTFTILCDDDNAQEYGVGGWGACSEDYYDIKGHDDSSVTDDDGTTHYTVNYNGQKQELYSTFAEAGWDPWMENTVTGRVTRVFQVPVGYDGVVFGITNNTIEYPEDGYIFDIYDPDMFFLFRMA